jgi:hypothetical protein
MLPGQQKTLLVAVAVNVLPYDFSTGVDIIKTGGNGARKIDVGKNPIAPQKAVIVAVAVYIETDDVSLRVHPFDIGESRARFGDWYKDTLAQQKTVNVGCFALDAGGTPTPQIHFGAREATIFSNRGSPRSLSQRGL